MKCKWMLVVLSIVLTTLAWGQIEVYSVSDFSLKNKMELTSLLGRRGGYSFTRMSLQDVRYISYDENKKIKIQWHNDYQEGYGGRWLKGWLLSGWAECENIKFLLDTDKRYGAVIVRDIAKHWTSNKAITVSYTDKATREEVSIVNANYEGDMFKQHYVFRDEWVIDLPYDIVGIYNRYIGERYPVYKISTSAGIMSINIPQKAEIAAIILSDTQTELNLFLRFVGQVWMKNLISFGCSNNSETLYWVAMNNVDNNVFTETNDKAVYTSITSIDAHLTPDRRMMPFDMTILNLFGNEREPVVFAIKLGATEWWRQMKGGYLKDVQVEGLKDIRTKIYLGNQNLKRDYGKQDTSLECYLFYPLDKIPPYNPKRFMRDIRALSPYGWWRYVLIDFDTRGAAAGDYVGQVKFYIQPIEDEQSEPIIKIMRLRIKVLQTKLPEPELRYSIFHFYPNVIKSLGDEATLAEAIKELYDSGHKTLWLSSRIYPLNRNNEVIRPILQDINDVVGWWYESSINDKPIWGLQAPRAIGDLLSYYQGYKWDKTIILQNGLDYVFQVAGRITTEDIATGNYPEWLPTLYRKMAAAYVSYLKDKGFEDVWFYEVGEPRNEGWKGIVAGMMKNRWLKEGGFTTFSTLNGIDCVSVMDYTDYIAGNMGLPLSRKYVQQLNKPFWLYNLMNYERMAHGYYAILIGAQAYCQEGFVLRSSDMFNDFGAVWHYEHPAWWLARITSNGGIVYDIRWFRAREGIDDARIYAYLKNSVKKALDNPQDVMHSSWGIAYLQYIGRTVRDEFDYYRQCQQDGIDGSVYKQVKTQVLSRLISIERMQNIMPSNTYFCRYTFDQPDENITGRLVSGKDGKALNVINSSVYLPLITLNTPRKYIRCKFWVKQSISSPTINGFSEVYLYAYDASGNLVHYTYTAFKGSFNWQEITRYLNTKDAVAIRMQVISHNARTYIDDVRFY